MPFTVVSFATSGAYARELGGLLDSCKRFGVAIESAIVQPMGSWERNCGIKPIFIANMLNALRQTVVWMDADARLMKYPHAFDLIEEDLAFFTLHHPSPHTRTEVLSGTVMVHDTPAAHDVMDAWIEWCKSNPEEWDQKGLEHAIAQCPHATIHALPESYCYIENPYHHRMIEVEPVVLHRQASRTLKPQMQGVTA